MRDELVALIAQSARQASARLQFYRTAFGFAGTAGLESTDTVLELAEGLLDGGRVSLEWLLEEAATLQPGTGKMLMNMIALAADCLPHGGIVSVEGRFSVSALGDGARVEGVNRRALSRDVRADHLTARCVQAYFTKRLAERLGGILEVREAAPDAEIGRAHV